jgi:glycosyltransferase involved in cell wall biosynthesis
MVTSSFPQSGNSGIGFVSRLAEKLVKNEGFEVVVLAPGYPGSKLLEQSNGLKTYRYPYFFPSKYQQLSYGDGILSNLQKNVITKIQVPFFIIAQLFFLLYLTIKERVDIVHAHWVIPQGTVAAICKIVTRRPLVASVHGSDFTRPKSRFLNTFRRFSLNTCNTVTVNSSFMADKVNNYKPNESVLIPMGVDSEFFHPGSYSRKIKEKHQISGPMILAVARLIEIKGVEYLIKAMVIVLKKAPDAKLVIVGDGILKEQLTRLSRDLGIETSIIFAGLILQPETVAEYFRTCDVFVLPSITDSKGQAEALGVVLLEAMACGKPVIGTKTGGIPDIITDGANGFLVPEKSPEPMAAKIITLLADDNLRRELGQNGLQLIKERFYWENIAKQFNTIYRQVVKNGYR